MTRLAGAGAAHPDRRHVLREDVRSGSPRLEESLLERGAERRRDSPGERRVGEADLEIPELHVWRKGAAYGVRQESTGAVVAKAQELKRDEREEAELRAAGDESG